MQILGIPGSLRAGSHNRRLLQLAAENLPDGVDFAVWEGLRDLPAYDEDEEGTPPLSVVAFRTAVAAADAILVATPEYNGSIPGALKNALDWGSRPRGTAAFRGKPVAVIGASTGSFGGVWAQAETKKILGLMGSRVVDADLSVGKAHERLAEPDEEITQGLRRVLDVLFEEAAARPVAA
jgi:chromate reductase, NAD(P)H dehydrogenase (quinone)